MDPDFGGGMASFDAMFQLVGTLIAIGFVVVIGSIIWGVVRTAGRAVRNSAAPEVTAQARIVDKRAEVSGGGTTHWPGAIGSDGIPAAPMTSSDPVTRSHLVTFEQPGGARFELEVPGHEYGLLVVGDTGSVTMKGTRYLGFQREILR